MFTGNGERKLQPWRSATGGPSSFTWFAPISETGRTSYPLSCLFYYFHVVESSPELAHPEDRRSGQEGGRGLSVLQLLASGKSKKERIGPWQSFLYRGIKNGRRRESAAQFHPSSRPSEKPRREISRNLRQRCIAGAAAQPRFAVVPAARQKQTLACKARAIEGNNTVSRARAYKQAARIMHANR